MVITKAFIDEVVDAKISAYRLSPCPETQFAEHQFRDSQLVAGLLEGFWSGIFSTVPVEWECVRRELLNACETAFNCGVAIGKAARDEELLKLLDAG